ncbi:amidoligase family protein [Microvirga arabica]|uniref:Amidoligase family protein n=1 Tax=Microvirga arabica TaxID=1128671 RepID=A0ABV6Y6V8_9HYPH|nr:amidoligase family protein [Microvirga arabica]MBM1170316.1 amidoligase family protein [Microvirga arabica]
MLAADGSARRVGVEVEFLGPSVSAAAAALARDLGGVVEPEDPHAVKVRGTRLGNLSIELDLRHIHPARHPDLDVGLGRRGAAFLGTLVSPFVPRELITAPIPAAQLGDVDKALASVRSVGARGRGVIFQNSLSLHFNIDPPSLDVRTLTAFLKGFLLVSDDLRRQTARGSLRLALALPPDYPESYKERVLARDYWPGLPDLTADYLAANPTRQRALDLLPVLAHLNEAQVRQALPREKIGPRPVFHYRLPHAYLSDPDWSILPDWYGWLKVERIAAELVRGEDNPREFV